MNVTIIFAFKVALTLGALCCNGVIKNCDNPSGFVSGTQPVTGNVMAALNGGNGDTPFTRGLLIFEADFLLANKEIQTHLGTGLTPICGAMVRTFLSKSLKQPDCM